MAEPPAEAEVLLGADALFNMGARPEWAELAVTDGASPLTVVHLDPDDVGAGGEAPVHLPWRVVVGIVSGRPAGPPPGYLDVALCTRTPGPGWVQVDEADEAVADLAGAAAANPRAAAVMAQLLRLNEPLTLAGGLMAESFAYSMLLAGPEFATWKAARAPRPHRASDRPVLVDREGEAVVLTLNRPEVRNAYDSATRDALIDTLRSLAALPDPPPVVLAGNGPSFCSGGDLSQFGTTPDPVTAHAARTARGPGLLLHRLGATARVHGACVGAGIELPAFCHRVLARPDATFRLPEVSMGLVPGAGGTASILARIGRHRTAYLGLTGRPVTAEVALSWGLVDQVGW